MYTILLRFSNSLATNFLSLNDEQYVNRPAFIDLNPLELKYYPFRIILNKCNGICNVIFSKLRVPKKKEK